MVAAAEVVDDDPELDPLSVSSFFWVLEALPILRQLLISVQVRQGLPSGPRTIPGGNGVDDELSALAALVWSGAGIVK
jgi:hypothetical protein